MIVRETFVYRRDRGCSRKDAECVAQAVALQAELGGMTARILQELLFTLCSSLKRNVFIEVSKAG